MEYTSRTLSEITSFKEIQNGLEGKTIETSFQIKVFSDQIIRINISPEEDFDFPSYATIAVPDVEVTYEIQENDQSVELHTDQLILQLWKKPLRFNFYTKDRREINCEDPGLGTAINQGQLITHKKLQTGERFVGLGEKIGGLDRRGTGLTNWNTDHYGYGPETDPIYSSIPFYIGIHNQIVYGIFLDNSSKSHFNFGASNERFSSFTVEQGNLNYFFMFGNSIAEVIRNYTHITGRMDLPPLWSLGYQQSRYSYFPEAEVMTIANTFREKNIPCDVIVLDIHHMDYYKIFTWDNSRFPDPQALITKLKDLGFETVVICDPGIKIEEGYRPYEEGLNENLFIKYPDGSNYIGQVWPGWCCFPDFTNKKTREWWGRQLKFYTDIGISGFWNDMNEIATWGNFIPNTMTFDYEGRKTSNLQARNIYGLEMARSTFNGAKKLLAGKRPFNLTRSAFAGIQRYSAKWTGDNSATDDHMLLGIKLQNSLGLSGVSFTGNDVGGFQKDATPELYARWIALGAFSPFFRGHSLFNTRASEPWSYGERIEGIARNYTRLRYKLLPYLYSLFYESTRTGMPVVRSLAIDYTFNDVIYQKPYEAQYMLGPNILVAPIASNQKIAKVYLPPGEWYDLFDGVFYNGDQEVYIDTPIYKIPVFIKGSTITPAQNVIQSTKMNENKELELHIYNGSTKEAFEYYEDDGITYDYQQENYYRRKLIFDGPNRLIVLSNPQGLWNTQFEILKMVFHGFDDSVDFEMDGNKLTIEKVTNDLIDPFVDLDPLGAPQQSLKGNPKLSYIPLTKGEIKITWISNQ